MGTNWLVPKAVSIRIQERFQRTESRSRLGHKGGQWKGIEGDVLRVVMKRGKRTILSETTLVFV